MSDELSERIATLSPEKRALLELRLKKIEPPSGIAPAQAVAGTSLSQPALQAPEAPGAGKELEFSLFFFSGDGATTASDKYRLLLECARFADENGFAAVWTPERHFKPFGGLYPNPSVITAALAMLTNRIQLRAGSVVLPLQNTLRVAEEWATVDNLSGGRIGVAFASGWLADDFVLAPDNYADRKEMMFREIDTIKRLWRGEPVRQRNGRGDYVEVRAYPNPLQDELPLWITATHRETFVRAGQIGANVLTGLMEQSIEHCAESIKAYRASLLAHGHDPRGGKISIMLHTHIGADLDDVKRRVRQPFCEYLKSFLRMTGDDASAKERGAAGAIAEEDQETLLRFAFERYFNTSALIGTPSSCERMIASLKAIDADEVACLLDFGLDTQTILEGLTHLNRLRVNSAASRKELALSR